MFVITKVHTELNVQTTFSKKVPFTDKKTSKDTKKFISQNLQSFFQHSSRTFPGIVIVWY